MNRKLRNITNNIYPIAAIGIVLIVWQVVSMAGLVPKFLLPSPLQVLEALWEDRGQLLGHLKVTLLEALLGLMIGILTGFGMAVLMDRLEWAKKMLYPLLVMTQTIPTIAIAPLLVLWMGYDMAPKVTLIVLVTFFPIAVGLLEGFEATDQDTLRLMKAMGANEWQVFWHVKLPSSLGRFFAGVRIAASYAIVGAVISEWLGGYEGLGVYMTRVRKSYAFDKMFAVIFLISGLSLVLMWLVAKVEKRCMPWEIRGEEEKSDE